MKLFAKRINIALTFAIVVGIALFGNSKALAAAGALDMTFGAGGKVITNFNGYDEGVAAALQPDGKIIVVGKTVTARWFGYDSVLARYNKDGSLDTTFGVNGRVVTDIGNNSNGAQSVSIQADGKIVVGGSSTSSSGTASEDLSALARYNSNGALDQTFGKGGIVMIPMPEGEQFWPGGSALQSGGKIIVAGEGGGGFTLKRYNTDGSPDNSFGVAVAVPAINNGAASPKAIAIQPDDKIIVVGWAGDGIVDYFAVARFTSDGNIDTTFGDANGLTLTDIGTEDWVNNVAVQPDGKILVSGTFLGPTTKCWSTSYYAVLARYNSDGALDTGFGSSGIVKTNFGKDKADEGNAIALQKDGKILLAGSSAPCGYAEYSDFALARYNPSGILDATFGLGGIITTDFDNTQDIAHSVLLQPDGKILLAGGRSGIKLARYNAAPMSMIFTSIGAQDGWILEASKGSRVGGAANSRTTTFNIGDMKDGRQYLDILSFNTADLPDNAVITSAALKFKKSAIIGGNPATILQGFMVDIKKGFFGASAALEIGDFQAAANKSFGSFTPAPVNNWYTIQLTGAQAYINKLATNGGLTQIRLRFKLGTNNDAVANYLSLHSGNAPAENRPQLAVTYSMP